jgi:trigger factor
MIKSRFREEIDRELVDRLVPRYWKQAQAEASLEPLMAPRIGDVDVSAGASLTFVATVEVRPEIALSDDRSFTLPDDDTEPGEAEVDEVLERLRADLSPWVDVARPAGRGDRVAIEIRREGQEGEPDRIDVEVGDPSVWEELSLAVTGLEAEGTTAFSRRVRTGEGAGEEAQERYQVEVLKVQEREPIPLDDAMAKKLGDLEGLEDLRRQVTERLRGEKRTALRERREEALLSQLRDRHAFELPEGVVDREVEEMLHDYAHGLAGRGVDLERTEMDWSALATQARPMAERRVHTRLVLDAIADADGVTVSEEEFESALAGIARAQRKTTAAVRQALDQAGKLQGLRAQMRRQKVIRGLLGEDSGMQDEQRPESGDAEEIPADTPGPSRD